MNDYTGKRLHDARYQDLLREACGSSLLHAARRNEGTHLSGSREPRWPQMLIRAAALPLLVVLFVTASLAALNSF